MKRVTTSSSMRGNQSAQNHHCLQMHMAIPDVHFSYVAFLYFQVICKRHESKFSESGSFRVRVSLLLNTIKRVQPAQEDWLKSSKIHSKVKVQIIILIIDYINVPSFRVQWSDDIYDMHLHKKFISLVCSTRYEYSTEINDLKHSASIKPWQAHS